MKNLILAIAFCPLLLNAQTTPNDGDWKSQYVKLQNTPEAEWMVRSGDIDNLGFGWEANFDPFSGKETPSHFYPWDRNPKDTLGFDMIMLPSSMGVKSEPCGGDGYSGQYGMMKETYGKTNFAFTIPMNLPVETKITSASIMMFVDDFQKPVFCSNFEAYINGRRAPFIEKALNALNQTGPIGKMITLNVPADFLDSLKSKNLTLYIDDATTGAADGYAVDFIKILVNEKKDIKVGKATLRGGVYDKTSGKAISGATVELSEGATMKTTTKGEYTFPGVTPGLVVVEVTAVGYKSQTVTIDVIVGQANTIDVFLVK